eukprot:628679_1
MEVASIFRSGALYWFCLMNISSGGDPTEIIQNEYLKRPRSTLSTALYWFCLQTSQHYHLKFITVVTLDSNKRVMVTKAEECAANEALKQYFAVTSIHSSVLHSS